MSASSVEWQLTRSFDPGLYCHTARTLSMSASCQAFCSQKLGTSTTSGFQPCRARPFSTLRASLRQVPAHTFTWKG